MIDPITTPLVQVPSSAASTDSASAAQTRERLRAESDLVTISEEGRALLKGRTEAEPETRETSFTEEDWLERYGVRAGTKTLAGGNKRVVNISGASLEILEYEGDRLVGSIKGTMTESGLSLDAEAYDKNGEVERTIHSDLVRLEDGTARMSRNVQWFDSGKLSRNMRETMTLTNPKDLGGIGGLTDLALDDFVDTADLTPELVSKVTLDNHLTQYNASIQEYENGILRRDTVIEQKAAYTNLTNRAAVEIAGLAGKSTRELQHSMSLSVDTREYDGNGDLLRTVAFSDEHTDGPGSEDGRMDQKIAVSWYAKGELVRTGSGTLTMDEAEGAKLPKRPSFIELLQLKEEEYASEDPMSPEQLLSKKLPESAGEDDYFTQAMRKYMGRGGYGTAGGLADYGPGSNPYSLAWNSDVYADGQVVSHREDRESAVANTLNRGLTFRKGGSLIEDAQQGLLRRSEHVDESLENGRVKNRAELSAREFVKQNENGADLLRTHVKGSADGDAQDLSLAKTLDGGLEANDAEARAASKAMAQDADPAFRDFHSLLRFKD